jgi:hypothetical protein
MGVLEIGVAFCSGGMYPAMLCAMAQLTICRRVLLNRRRDSVLR